MIPGRVARRFIRSRRCDPRLAVSLRDRQQRSASWPQSYELPSHCLNRFAPSSASEAAAAPVVLSGALCDQPEGRIVLKEG